MQFFLVIVLIIVTLLMIGVILLQRSEGGGLGMGGGNMDGLMSTRGTANFLTRTTAILATLFICINLLLAFLSSRDNGAHNLAGAIEAIEEKSTEPAAPVSQ